MRAASRSSRLANLEGELFALAGDVDLGLALVLVSCFFAFLAMLLGAVSKIRTLTAVSCFSLAVPLAAALQYSLARWDALDGGASDGQVLARWAAICCMLLFLCLAGTVALRKALATMQLPITNSGPGLPLPYASLRNFCYLDWNATSCIFPEVSREMVPFLGEKFGNPSSDHMPGRSCKRAMDLARQRVAALLGCSPDEILFTSCGSESDNHAILGALALGAPRGRDHIVTSAIEHPAILRCLEWLEAEGRAKVTRVPVDSEGLVDAGDVAAAITSRTALVTVMHSNNEVGSVQPIAEIAAACLARSVLLHTDAAQSIGKVRAKASELNADLITIVGHKFGAPKGVAALYIRRGVELPPLLRGGGQEKGRRAGTENVLLAAAMGKAAEVVEGEFEALVTHLRSMRDRLRRRLLDSLGEHAARVSFNGPDDESKRLPNTLSVSIQGLQAAPLLASIGDKVAASAGAACHSGGGGGAISEVLAAMKVPADRARGTLRLSVGRHTTTREVDRGARLLAVAILKGLIEESKRR